MVQKLRLNHAVSFLEKDDIIAVYLGFRFIFFKGVAAEYFHNLLECLEKDSVPESIPDDFLAYLAQNQIISNKEAIC